MAGYLMGLLGMGLVVALPVAAQETALDRYVAQPDSVYDWEVVGSDQPDWWDVTGSLYDTFFLKLTSQEWRSPEEVDRTLWEHELIVVTPELSPRKTVLLLIDGGSNTADPIRNGEDAIGLIANALRMPVAVVRQVPNQPLYFSDEDNVRRTEDEILAYSLDKYMETGDETWPVHLAMTKAAVRAMDATEEFLEDHRGIAVDDFIVLGGSKRGWTTWLTAAVDPRVKAIMPISADLLNLKNQFNHHWGAYGFYAPAVGDYAGYDLSCRLQSAHGMELSRIIDPYYYRDRYTMPKLIINSTGDQFFVTDSASLYYDDLPGPKFLRNTFNTDHRQGDQENLLNIIKSALLWVDDVNHDRSGPPFSWEVEEDGTIRVTTGEGTQPNQVLLWQAVNPEERDFRLEEIGAAWTSTRLTRNDEGEFVGSVTVPEQGFISYSVELRYDEDNFGGLLDLTQVYTTEARVLPDVLPYKETACLADTLGTLENPSNGSGQSGIGVISGWACDASTVEIELNGNKYLPAAYGTSRRDTIGVCADENNGFGLLYNLNLLGDGHHSIRALSEGRVIDAAEFDVTTFGSNFVRGLEGEYSLPDFPASGQSVNVVWEESLQNFAISQYNHAAAEQTAASATSLRVASPANLENPADGSYQSGIAVISGWVCDAESVEVEIDGVRTLDVAYGTTRLDTANVCGDSDNGFGLLYNLNLFGQGSHQIRLLADGVEVDQATFHITTLGDSFVRDADGYFRLEGFPDPDTAVDLRWNEGRQNFLVEDLIFLN